MKPYLESVWNVTLDRPPQEWIVAIVVALFLALALAGANAALRRWVKVTDESVPLVGLAVIAIFCGMVIAGMHIELNNKGIGRRPSAGRDRTGWWAGRRTGRRGTWIWRGAE